MPEIRIEIDESTKSIIQYMKAVKKNASPEVKRMKLSCPVPVVRPSEFANIDLQQLSDTLLRGAYNVSFIDPVFLEHLEGLVVDQSLQWHHVMESIVNTKLTNLYLKCQMCTTLRALLPRIQVRNFAERESTNEIIKYLKPSFELVVELILQVLELDEPQIDRLMLENNNFSKPYMPPLQTLSTFIHDPFCRTMLILHCPSEVKQKLQLVYDAFCEPENPDTDAVGLMEMIIELFDEKLEVKPFVHKVDGLTLFRFKNPCIKVVVSIFACFKMDASIRDVADTVQNFAEILNIPPDEVVFDLIHAAYLLKCEESIDLELLHLPKQHRVDFRWQYTSFFFGKLGSVICHLVELGKTRKEDVAEGLERCFKHLVLMFDQADKSWQAASFLILLKTLQPALGAEAFEKFKSLRRAHMTASPELKSLLPTEDQLIEHTEVDYFFKAVSDVTLLGTPEEPRFWSHFENLALQCQFDVFDAYTCALIAGGKLLEAGKQFIGNNFRAQIPSVMELEERMTVFDHTFLLMSRILMRNNSVNIKLFVNGGAGKTEAEHAIFFNWSMCYIKRVRNNELLTRDIDGKTDELRPKVIALIKSANLEVGLEEEFEEEEDKVAEPEKEAEPDEPMDTSETPGTSGDDVVKLEEEEVEPQEAEQKEEATEDSVAKPEEEAEKEKPEASSEDVKIEDVTTEEAEASENKKEKKEKEEEKPPEKDKLPVTWHALHCPLPQISKKLAEEYLRILKEGQPFWNTDDQDLNLGALIAAIPVIGVLLLEEYDDKKHRLDKKMNEEFMLNILHGFSKLTCLLMCLLEWLDCQPDTRARTTLATTIKSSLDKCILESESTDPELSLRWRFIKSTTSHILVEMIDKSPVFPEVTCTAFSAARRFCPFVYRDEIPDHIKQKHAWYYMRQQGWASPHCLRLLEHANSAGESNFWTTIYLSKIIRTGCGDLMKTSVDMLFSLLMMSPLISVIKIQEKLMELWLGEKEEPVDHRFDPVAMSAAVRLMTHVLLLAEWLLDRLVNEDPNFKPQFQWTEASQVLAPEEDDPNKKEKWIHLLKGLLEISVNRFAKLLKKGQLCTMVNTIIQLIKSIAGAPDCHAKRLLIRRIQPEMIFQIAYIEPSSVSMELMEVFCEKGNESHRQLKILFLCALKRGNVQM